MTKKHIFKYGMRGQIITRILISFLLLWSAFLAYWFHQININFIESKKEQIAIQKSQLKNTIFYADNKLRYIIKTLSDETLTYAEFEKQWKVAKKSHPELTFQHYSSDGILIKKDHNSDLGSIDKNIVKSHLFNPQKISFFSCYDMCFFEVIGLRKEEDIKSGFLRISIPIDELIIYFREISAHQIFSIRKNNLEESPSIDTYSSFDLYNKFNQQYENIGVLYQELERYPIKIKKINNRHYSIINLGSDLSNVINFIAIEDISSEYEKLYNNFLSVVFFSLLLMILITSTLYLSLNISLEQLAYLSNVMGLVGKGEFTLARKNITKHTKNVPNTEIKLVFDTTKKLINEIQSRHDNLIYVANHDSLTGLINRRHFNKEMNYAILRNNQKFALIEIDLDYFKIINDTLGHAMGDQLLIIFSDMFKESIPYPNIVARTGGDEFFAIIFYDDFELVEACLNTLNEMADKTPLPDFNLNRISFSIGIALYPKHAKSLKGLSSCADVAMYENKRRKNKIYNLYTGHEASIKDENEQRYFSTIIYDNLRSDRIKLAFQPILSIQGNLFSFEVLSRFYDPKKKRSIDTEKTIRHAEKIHSIVNIDKVIFQKTLKVSSKLEKPVRLMINISTVTIFSENIEEYYIDTLRECNYPANKIVFEITETAELIKMDKVLHFIHTFNKIGVEFALDDFGSGFSSFSYLKKINLNYLKIDKSIIQGITHEKKNHSIMKSITRLAEELNIKIVAEGIESKEMLNAIKNYKVDYVQGYYFSRPLTSPCFERVKNNEQEPVNT